MKVISTAIANLLVIEPTVFEDDRGYFFERFNHRQFAQHVGREVNFVQDNHSLSVKNVLRGMHYQIQHPQGKLVNVVRGKVFDVVVDLRQSSITFGQHVSVELSAENKRSLWIPEGFAHGFLVLSDVAEVVYKTTEYWMPEYERCLSWNDTTVGIDWPIQESPVMSEKDRQGKPFKQIEYFP